MLKILLVFISFILYVQCGGDKKTNHISEDKIKEHFDKYIKKSQNDEDVQEFNKIIEIFKPPSYMFRDSFTDYSVGRQTLQCVICRAVIDTIKNLHEDGYTEESLSTTLADICVLIAMQTENMCMGIIPRLLPILLYIMDNQPNFKAESFCAIAFQSSDPNACPLADENYDFHIELPPKNVTTKTQKSTGETFQIIHVTDLHYDPAYEPFGLAECNEPVCCRYGQVERASSSWTMSYDDSSSIHSVKLDDNGIFSIDLNYAEEIQRLKKEFVPPKRNDIPLHKQAGFWGDFRNCDTPWWAVEDSLDHIIENPEVDDFDLVYHIGDVIDHGVWERSKELIQDSMSLTAQKMKNNFGDRPVLNALGNNEAEPMNQFPPASVTDPRFSSSWMYEMLIEEWRYWIPEETHSSMKQGGFYSTLVKPGLRAIVLNNNVCRRLNWWIHLQPSDTDGQLAWLVNTLHTAELNGERVHILTHVPPGGSDCMRIYTREYRRIMERFAGTVVAEFNGHTHKDEFKVYYEKENLEKPYLVAWNGGSVTANTNINPNYKVVDIDANTFEVVDSHVWIFNLTEANLTPERRPRWFKEYSFRENYGVADMSPSSIDSLLNRMVTTEQSLLTHDYHIFRGKSSDPQIATTCDDNCVRNILSTITSTELYDNTKGEALWNIYQENKNKLSN